METKQVTPIY